MSATERLKSFAGRILRLMDERDGITGDIGDVFQEVKSAGLNAPALRKVIAAMRMDPEKRQALEFDIDAYRMAVGLDASVSLDEQPRVVAAKMLAEGAGVRETARATGVKKSTVSDLSGKIAQAKSPDTPDPGPSERFMAATIAERGASPDVAEIALATARLHDQGQVHAANAVVAVVKAVAAGERLDAGPIPDFLDRRKAAQP